MSTNKQYIKGFNHGYILAQHDPELAKQLVKRIKSDNHYFKGIVSGKQEYDIEKIREKLVMPAKENAAAKNIEKNRGRQK